MFPISITSEIENKEELINYFENLKFNSYEQFERVRKFIIETNPYDNKQEIEKTHLRIDEVEQMREEIEKFLISVGKLIEFSKEIEKMTKEVPNES